MRIEIQHAFLPPLPNAQSLLFPKTYSLQPTAYSLLSYSLPSLPPCHESAIIPPMSVKTTRRPAFSEQQAAGLAQELYGIEGSVRELPSYGDQNFHLVAGPGQEFTLKIARADESEALLRLQNRALERLCQEHSKARFPRICPAADGCDLTPIPSPNGRQHWVRLLTYLPGVPLARYRPHSPRLLHRIGGALGRMDQLLLDLASPSNRQDHGWDLRLAVPTVRRHLWEIEGAQRRELVEHFLSRFEAQSVPAFESLRSSLIHNDVNDYNVLVDLDDGQEVLGLIDFGDLLNSFTISELAIACAYAILDKPDPIEAACHLLAGYHQAYPLTELEIELLLPFICMRLCTSLALSAHQQENEPDNQYLGISQRPAWAMLKRLRDEVNPRLAHYRLRQACGLTPCPGSAVLASRLQQLKDEGQFAPVLEPDLRSALVFDLSIGSPELGRLDIADNVEAFSRKLFRRLEDCGASLGVGRYDEVRGLYRSPVFQAPGNERKVWRSVHLGIDLFLEAGSPVFAPLQGTVHSLQDNDALLDYGPTVVLQHRIEGQEFFTLYGHLGSECLKELQLGQTIPRGGRIGSIGDFPANGNWPPHLHFQIIADLLDREGEFPGVASPGQRQVWLSLSPDPNLILGIPEQRFPQDGLDRAAMLAARRHWIGPSLSLSYRQPLQILGGFAQYLYDEQGQPYLDCVNNVCHVGHSHPRVVEAVSSQAAVLNTNTRYLHPRLTEYAQRLTATLPDPLEVCFFVSTGSEANDLALRLARTHTGRRDTLVLDGAYHGNLTALVEISPYKFDGPGGSGAPSYVHKLAMPDPYRGAYKGFDRHAGRRYADDVAARIRELQEQGSEPAAFIAEPLLGCGGQVVLPQGYLALAFEHVRRAGGLCIVDEVQLGFGRVGTHFWAFETQGVVPDIVTLGKPIGNGHPLAAVVTSREIAESFHNGMEYFNTFGGNPVSCAVGLAVLDVVADQDLQRHALQVGGYLKSRLTELMTRHPLIGDVRGLGLFLGVELVRDQDTLEPAAEEASYLIERMKERGILLSTDGPLHNVLKIKPPLVFNRENADMLVKSLDEVLAENVISGKAAMLR